MKRHADRLAQERIVDSALVQHKVTRLHAPFVDGYIQRPGDFVCILAIRRDDKQHNYAFIMEEIEAHEMGFGKQDSNREFMHDWQKCEEDLRKRCSYSIEYLSRQIAAAMMDYLEKNDPQFGYTPEQWAEFNR